MNYICYNNLFTSSSISFILMERLFSDEVQKRGESFEDFGVFVVVGLELLLPFPSKLKTKEVLGLFLRLIFKLLFLHYLTEILIYFSDLFFEVISLLMKDCKNLSNLMLM